MASRPTTWRVLAILSGPCLDPDVGADGLGAVSELADLVGVGAEVRLFVFASFLLVPIQVLAVCAGHQCKGGLRIVTLMMCHFLFTLVLKHRLIFHTNVALLPLT